MLNTSTFLNCNNIRKKNCFLIDTVTVTIDKSHLILMKINQTWFFYNFLLLKKIGCTVIFKDTVIRVAFIKFNCRYIMTNQLYAIVLSQFNIQQFKKIQ